MGASFPRLLGSGPIPARVSGTGTVSILAIPLDRLMSAGVPLLKAPYFTAPNLLVVGAYATHLQENTRYANAKGADAVWLQDTIDPILLETLGHRHGVLFPEKTSQGEAETEADFCARRQKAATDTSAKIFAIIAPHGSRNAADFVTKHCRFKYQAGSRVDVQVSMHETNFKSRIAQLSNANRSDEQREKEKEKKDDRKEKPGTKEGKPNKHEDLLCHECGEKGH